jgi:rhodanese-related sulfurtransferase
MRKIILCSCLFLLVLLPVSAAPSNLPQKLQAELQNYQQYLVPLPQAKEIHGRGAIFIDIRSAALYQKGHVPGALHMPITDLPQLLLERPGVLPKGQPVYVICCAKDRNAMYALLPLRMAGYDAYAVTGGGTDAWMHLEWPIEQGTAKPLETRYKTKLTSDGSASLMAINPSYHMMKAGRSYAIERGGLEQAARDNKSIFVVEIGETRNSLFAYAQQYSALVRLPLASWLADFPKNQTVYLVGADDKQLALGMVSLRMLGYDAVFAVER